MSHRLEEYHAGWAPFATEWYQELNKLVVSYWERREIDLLASEGSPYCAHSVIIAAARIFAEEDRACFEEGYSEDLIHVFRKNGLSLWRIPIVLDPPSLLFIKTGIPNGFSMARFKRQEIPCVAMRVEPMDEALKASLRKKYDVVTTYRRFDDRRMKDSSWGIEDFFIKRQDSWGSWRTISAQKIEGANNFGFDIIEQLISNTHPTHRMITQVPQFEQPIPQKMLEIIHAEDNSLWTQCIACINTSIHYILGLCGAIYTCFVNFFSIENSIETE